MISLGVETLHFCWLLYCVRWWDCFLWLGFPRCELGIQVESKEHILLSDTISFNMLVLLLEAITVDYRSVGG